MPSLTVVPPNPRAEAQRAWVERAAATARDQRRRRRSDLEARERAIEDAMDLFRTEHKLMSHRSLRIRPELVFRDRKLTAVTVDPALRPRRGELNPALAASIRDDIRGRPPLARLANRSGLAVPLEIAALGVAHFRGDAGDSTSFEDISTVGRLSWASLVGDRDVSAPGRARRHVVDALRRLSGERLVQLPSRSGRQQPWEGWSLLREDGEGSHEYTVPGAGFRLPVDFWLRGWAAVLTPAEIVAYLMIRHHAEKYPDAHGFKGVGVAPRVRRQQYGVTDSIYATLNELVEFGLLAFAPGDPNAAPSVRVVNRYQLNPGGLRVDAYSKVTTVLKLRPTPARIAGHDL